MSVNTYQLGDLVRCSGPFTNASDAAIDPSEVYFQVKNPSNQTTTYHYGQHAQLVKDSTGNYHVDIDADLCGTWYYRFYSTGTGQAADENSFIVENTQFG